MKQKTRTFLFIFTLLIVDFSLSLASKLDKKHKTAPNQHTKQEDQKQQNTHKNSTSSHHHSNHSASAAHAEQIPATPPPIGWSLDKNQAQNQHNNPNGFALQHHEQQHGHQQHPQQGFQPVQHHEQQHGHQMGAQQGLQPVQHHEQSGSHQQGVQQHPQGVHQNEHGIQQPQGIQQQPQGVQQQPPPQSSGIGTAIASGVGGLALGAGGGYLLSNMMNSGSSGEKVEATTVKVTEPATTVTEATTQPAEATTQPTEAPVPLTQASSVAETSPSSESSSVVDTSASASETASDSPADNTSPPSEAPVVVAAGLVPVIQSAKVPSDNSDTTQGTEAITEINNANTTTKGAASLTKASLGFAVLIITFQFLLNK